MIGWIIVLVVLLGFVGALVGLVLMVVSMFVNHRDRKLRNEAEAHVKILESHYDSIWRALKLRAGLTEDNRRDFNNIYPDIIDQSIDDDRMLDFLLDANPDFDPDEYVSLMEGIEADRQHFVLHQRRMLNLIEEHRQLLLGPTGRLVRNKAAITYVPVSVSYDRWGNKL